MPEPGPAARQDVERRRRLDPQARVAVVDATDHQPQPRSLRVRGHEPERGPALEHRLLGLADAADLEEVVHDPDRIEADVVGLADDPGEGRADRLGPARPRERRDLEAELHSLRSVPVCRSVARSAPTRTIVLPAVRCRSAPDVAHPTTPFVSVTLRYGQIALVPSVVRSCVNARTRESRRPVLLGQPEANVSLLLSGKWRIGCPMGECWA